MANYNASSIKVLDSITAIRKRPGMYIGGTDKTALHHCVLEVVSNSIDEFMNGYGNKIEVSVNKESIEVKDEGRGIPVGKMKNGEEALTAIFTETHSGAKFEDSGYKVSGGLHGVGLTAVNAISKKLLVISKRDGYNHTAEFQKGRQTKAVKKGVPTKSTGTTITFFPDAEIFDLVEFDYDMILEQIKELAYLTTGLTFIVRNDETSESTTFAPKNGLIDYMAEITEGEETIFKKPLYFKDSSGDTEVEFVCQFSNAKNEINKLYTNNIPNEAGTHLTGYRSAFTSFINNYVSDNGLWDGANFSGDLIRKGMRLILTVKMKDPVFVGQTKEKLSSTEIRVIVGNVVTTALENFSLSNKKELRTIIDSIIAFLNKDTTTQKIKEITKKSKILANTILPGKLSDCNKKGFASEIFIVEGNSAAGSMKSSRNRDFQAILPLRGKILNAGKNNLDKLLKNAEVQSLIKAFGAGIGDVFNISKMRYGKIILATDADIDGAHIRTLLLTFFFKYMREMIEEGYVYAAVPPLYQVTKGSKIDFAYSDEELTEVLKTNNGIVERFKGLGEMSPMQLWETTMDPDNRILHQITLDDEPAAEKLFEILMGTKVLPRKNFIIEHSTLADLDL